MTSTYTPTTVVQGFNQEVPINSNFTDIKIALDQCLQRLSALDNAMESDLDMANFQLLNLPAPVTPTDAVRLQDVDSLAVNEVIQEITFATTISIDATAMTVAKLLLTGNTTITLTGTPADQKPLLVLLSQDGTGSRIVTWGASSRFSTDGPVPVLSTTGGKLDYMLYRYNADAAKFDLLATNRGF
jgi:hypothetical protein